jgi:type II secretory pathway predicted ATPase ExeA
MLNGNRRGEGTSVLDFVCRAAWGQMEGGSGPQAIPLGMSQTNERLPTREQIERRARQIYVERGCQDGSELADWLAAEKELAQQIGEQDKRVRTFSSDSQQNCRRTPMFLDFYGLREQPFGMTPDPAYLYSSRTHSEALASLTLGIADTRGFLTLIAEPGMGKTTLLYQLSDELRDSSRIVLLSQTQCNSREFIEYILQDLGVETKGMGLVAMHGQLNEILFEELLAGKRFVLIVDEAQNLDDTVLETVRMLSNFETHNAKLLQIILAGQPGLAAKLAQPRLSQLRQRVAVLCRLDHFTVEETGLYIEHRLKVAGYSGEPIFDPAAIGLLAKQSKGIPRNINNISYNSLMLAYTRGIRTVTAEIVREAVSRLDLALLASEPVTVAEVVPTPVAQVAAAHAAAAGTVSAGAASVRVSAPHSAPMAASSASNIRERPMKASLTYDASKKVSVSKWPVRSAILVVFLLSGTMLLALLGRSESTRAITPEMFNNSSDAHGALIPADRSEGASASYDAAPQDTGNGQVLTVVAGPQQTLKDLCLRYAGHFDSDLSKQILSLNPDLKDPDHLVDGQLIRIPLPPGAMRKVNDTAEAATASKSETSGNLFSRFTALLRGRK